MKKIDLIKIGLIPIGISVLFIIIGIISESIILYNLMSLSFILFWTYAGYEVGKQVSGFLKVVFFVHLVPIFIVILQISGIIYGEITNGYRPDFIRFIGEVYFLPIMNLMFDLFVSTLESGAITSLGVMIITFSIGMCKSKSLNE